MSAEPFAPPSEGWRPVSPKLATVRRWAAIPLVVLLALIGAGVLIAVDFAAWAVVPVLVAVILGGWLWWLIGRQVAAIGYAERDEDLLVTSGILFRRLVIVPYGRMQLVDVNAGPLDQRYRLAKLQLHTAAATTDATIPGLPREEAAALRDRLAARGEARTSGL
jgi:membrane protein YdbS with pleckstrin-like domain